MLNTIYTRFQAEGKLFAEVIGEHGQPGAYVVDKVYQAMYNEDKELNKDMAAAVLNECGNNWIAPIRLLEILFLCSRNLTGLFILLT